MLLRPRVALVGDRIPRRRVRPGADVPLLAPLGREEGLSLVPLPGGGAALALCSVGPDSDDLRARPGRQQARLELQAHVARRLPRPAPAPVADGLPAAEAAAPRVPRLDVAVHKRQRMLVLEVVEVPLALFNHRRPARRLPHLVVHPREGDAPRGVGADGDAAVQLVQRLGVVVPRVHRDDVVAR